MSEWRDIWKVIINASRESLLSKDTDLSAFIELENKYPDDKMILFEKGIVYECLKDTDNAILYYSKAADTTTGLPVEHWRERAIYFLNRIKSRGCSISTDLNSTQEYYNIQWDSFFNIHSYCYLDSYLRYLAVSSVSRVHSEPAMSIVIFRTCLEIGLWTYFIETEEINGDYKRKNYRKDRKSRDINLDDLLEELKAQKVIKSNEYTAYDKIRIFGNEAAHPKTLDIDLKPYTYTDEELKVILDYFNQALCFLNERAKLNHYKR